MPKIPNCLSSSTQSRRHFFRAATASAIGLSRASSAAEARPNVLGQMPGYSPQIGVLISEMTWMRSAVLRAVKGMTQTQLDFLLDDKANRNGALLLHLAATERLYQLNTLDHVGVQALQDNSAFKEWQVPMQLGDAGRLQIKGHDLDYYLNILRETREKTLTEFRKRDDQWLLSVDNSFVWGPTNNLCKWFHVCEHESHHAGQISLLASRTPGAKRTNG